MPNCARIIALIDMDCFYVQVEERDDPSIKGKPAAVVQYNAWKGGGLIAVNYEARAKGVNRHMRGDDAKAACSEILLVKVPELRGKADLTKYRSAGSEVIKVLSEFPTVVERASVDEAYLDLTQMVEQRISASGGSWDISTALDNLDEEYLRNNFVMGHESTTSWLTTVKDEGIMSVADIKLAIGAEIVGQMRRAVLEKTGFRCSAGIAHNKVLAKLVCGINKPNKQTVLPFSSVSQLYSTTPVKKVRNLGGKLGDVLLEQFNIETMEDLGRLSEKDLCQSFGNKTGSWLYHLALGDDDEPVTARQLPKSIGCNKNFPGREALKKLDKIKHWIDQLSSEVVERIQKDFDTNNRKSKSLTLHIRFEDGNQLSKSCGAPSYDTNRMATDVYSVIEKIFSKNPNLPITSLGIIASKFEDELNSTTFQKIDSFFTKQGPKVKATPSATVTRVSDLDPEVTLQGHHSLSAENSPVLSPKPSTSKAFFTPQPSTSKTISPFSVSPKPCTSKSMFALEQAQEEQRFRNPFEGVISSTEEFFERIAEAEIFVAEKLNKIEKNGANDGDGVRIFNRNLTQSESDKNILKLGSNFGAENFQNQNFSPLTSADPSTCTPTRKVPLKAFTQKCERCGQSIVIWDLEVHKDYHYAKDVQREINGLPPLNPTVDKDKKKFEPVTLPKRIKPVVKRKGQRSTSDSAGKRGRGNEGAGMRSIQFYFKPLTPTTSQDS